MLSYDIAMGIVVYSLIHVDLAVHQPSDMDSSVDRMCSATRVESRQIVVGFFEQIAYIVLIPRYGIRLLDEKQSYDVLKGSLGVELRHTGHSLRLSLIVLLNRFILGTKGGCFGSLSVAGRHGRFGLPVVLRPELERRGFAADQLLRERCHGFTTRATFTRSDILRILIILPHIIGRSGKNVIKNLLGVWPFCDVV